MKKRLLLTLLATAMLTLVACSSNKSAEAAPEPEVTVIDSSGKDPDVETSETETETSETETETSETETEASETETETPDVGVSEATYDTSILGTFYGRDFADGITLQYLMDNVQDFSEITYNYGKTEIVSFDWPKEKGVYAHPAICPIAEANDTSIENAETITLTGYVVTIWYWKTQQYVSDDISWGGCRTSEELVALYGEPDGVIEYDDNTYGHIICYEYKCSPYQITFSFVEDGAILKSVACHKIL